MSDHNSSEQKILECMKDERAHSPRDLSISCRMNEPAIRYHLRKLVSLGLIKKCPESGEALRPGRKSEFYRYLSSSEARTAIVLCQAILVNFESFRADDDPARILADWFLETMKDSRGKHGLSLKELVSWLNQNHYVANWLAGRSGPEVLISNCPYCDLQSGSDLLCRMDTVIISKLTGKLWKKECHIEPAYAGGVCRFVLNP